MTTSSYTVAKGAGVQKGVLTACRILANPTRHNILSLLVAARSEKKELCVNEIGGAIGASQSATSHQLALLEAYGVVEGVRMGQTTCYDLTNAPLTKTIEKIIRIFQSKP